jgi:LysR family transcriptional regulator, positive regulator for ilvC
MDTRALRAFAALSGTLHFGRAAEQCNLSASAFSRLIQRLEDELGCRLFERNNRTVRLTPQGQTLQLQAGELADRLARLELELTDRSRPLSGAISLYCSVTASYSLLSDLLPAYRRTYPRVELNLHTGDEASAIRRVLQGRDDVAIAARPDRLPAGLRFLELATTPLVFIAPAASAIDPSLLAAGAAAESRRAWAECPMILPEAGLARDRIDAWFRARRVRPRVYAQVSGNEAIAAMVSLGCGMGVVPMLVLGSNPLRDGVRIIDVVPELPPFRIGLCSRRQTLQNPLVASLWQLAGAVRGSADIARGAAV